MLLHLPFGKRSFIIGYQQLMRQDTTVIQVIDIFRIINLVFHFIRTFVITQHKHRLGKNRDITVLHTSPIIGLVFRTFVFIVCHYNLTEIVHVLIRLLTGLVGRSSLLRCLSVLRIQLRLQYFHLVLACTFQVACFLTSLGTILIACQEIGILFQHRSIVTDGTGIISRPVTQQAPVEDRHHIVRLYLEHKVEILYSPVIVSYLGTEQAPVVMPDEVILVDVKSQVVIAHSPPQVVLVIACQRTVDIHARIAHRQAYGFGQVAFGIGILVPLKEKHAP